MIRVVVDGRNKFAQGLFAEQFFFRHFFIAFVLKEDIAEKKTKAAIVYDCVRDQQKLLFRRKRGNPQTLKESSPNLCVNYFRHNMQEAA